MKVAFEALGFDVRMMRGGLAPLVWQLAREFVDRGHRVSVVTPTHGRLDHLAARYDVTELDHHDEHPVPLVPDPAVWPDPPGDRTVATRAHLLRHEGVDVYLLGNDQLDLLPERIYPAATSEGTDPAFFKPLVFQVAALRFLLRRFGDGGEAAGHGTDGEGTGGEPVLVQAYEPYYHYLLPAVLAADPRFRVVSTIASNMPIDLGVYRPQLARLLAMFGTRVDLDRYLDPPAPVAVPDDPESVRAAALAAAWAGHLPHTRLSAGRGADHVSLFALIADHCDGIDFLTPGQRDFYSTFRDTPYEAAFRRTAVARVVRDNAAKQFVGGCGVPRPWLDRDPGTVDRTRVLGGLGLDPARPTFYHVARYSVHHKGQWELVRAVEAVLDTDPEVNFLLRMATAAGGDAPVGEPYFQRVADRFPDRVRLFWSMADEETFFGEAVAADYCLFPSKYELDTFLIAQGQAMACGAVPIATAQESTRHYRRAPGFDLPRSFTPDDPRLTAALTVRIHEAARLWRTDPAGYHRLSADAAALARTFTYAGAADRRLDRFARLLAGDPLPAPVQHLTGYGWFDRIDGRRWQTHRAAIRAAAIGFADLETVRRCGPVDADTLRRLHAAAEHRGDLDRCLELAELLGDTARAGALRSRCRVLPHPDGNELRYGTAGAAGVDLVTPDGRPRPLEPDGPAFRIVLPVADTPGVPVFLLRLASGRSTWDVPPVAP
ncbi:glycosyltransferase [Polymorphospora sp. NPDC051019]|uniref:glycosyltransferase n=1 Tax=Polymorphospora sp. NPDC051019 TaxID=3155725 RepID=UPI003415D08D